jgi:hypothetical protein
MTRYDNLVGYSKLLEFSGNTNHTEEVFGLSLRDDSNPNILCPGGWDKDFVGQGVL